MPIQFSCTQCNKQLKVPDESAGAKARCPQCQTVIEIPSAASAMAAAAAPSFAQPPSDSVNPYSAPSAGIEAKSLKPTGQPTAVGPGEVIEYAWNVWKQNLGILVGVTAIVLGISIGVSVLQQLLVPLLAQQMSFEMIQLLVMGIGLIGNVINIFLGIGQTHIVLKVIRGQHADFAELFGGSSLFLRVLGASIVAGLAVMVGFIALIIPGILLCLLFWPFYYLIVDRKAKAMESFSMAYPIGKLNFGTTFVLGLASMGIYIVGVMALCVGVFFALPLISTIYCTAYLMMSGQIGVRAKH